MHKGPLGEGRSSLRTVLESGFPLGGLPGAASNGPSPNAAVLGRHLVRGGSGSGLRFPEFTAARRYVSMSWRDRSRADPDATKRRPENSAFVYEKNLEKPEQLG